MAVIYRGPTRGYQLTDDDVLWLARGFVGEHGNDCNRNEARALFHSWMDRFLLVNAVWLRKRYSFKQLLRAHSQALKASWGDVNSSLCQKHPNDCTPSKIARRHRIWALTISQLKSYGVYAYALEAQNGTLERIIQEPTYDFAACSLTRRQSRPCAGKDIHGSCYLTYDCLTSKEKGMVIPGEVTIDTVTAEKAGKFGLFVVGLVIAYGVYKFFSER